MGARTGRLLEQEEPRLARRGSEPQPCPARGSDAGQSPGAARQAVKGWRSISGAELQFQPEPDPAAEAADAPPADADPAAGDAEAGGGGSPAPPPPPPPPPPRRDAISEGVEELHLALAAGDEGGERGEG